MFIDPHVHCRDWQEARKETIAHALSVAERAGFTAIFDMSNSKPPVLSLEVASGRIRLAQQAASPVWYGLYMGLTAALQGQISEAVHAYNTLDNIVGFKLFAAHSTNELGVVQEEQQQFCYRKVAEERYKSVLAVHCEKEKLMDRTKFDYSRPWTHCLAQPPEAEVESVKDQIRFAREAGFEGTLHIPHISVPEAVELVYDAKRFMRITCGATPHHTVLCEEDMHLEDGLLLKMNPPLRSRDMMIGMQRVAKEGKVDWWETDHAPHTLWDKLDPTNPKPFASGIPGLAFYQRFIRWLARQGFTEQQIADMTFNNIKKAFELDLEPRQVSVASDISYRLAAEYPFDPYKHLEI